MAYENKTGLPSVTEILSPYISKEWFTEESRLRGDAVHAACSAYLQGLFIPPLASEHQPYFDSAKRWIDCAVDRVILAEERLIDPVRGYCGKPDLIAVLHGDEYPVLVDFKTGQATAPAWRLQIAAYRKLAATDKKILTVRGISVRLKSDGSGALVTEYPKDYSVDFNIFTGLLNAHYYFKGGCTNG